MSQLIREYLLNDNNVLQEQTTTPRSPEDRFYVIVPETVQTDHIGHEMESGRLMAQSFHIGRKVEAARAAAGIGFVDITAVVLAVRNTRELEKVLSELRINMMQHGKKPFELCLYRDYNENVYETENGVLTAIVAGPVLRSTVDHILGHLETY